jgi:hypothetical protein
MGKTRAELREQARWLLDKQADNYLKTSDATLFDMNDALMRGYSVYAQKTRAFPVRYALASVAGVGEYGFAAFGAQSVDTDLIAVSAAANNTTALTIAAQPAQLSYVTVSIKNGTAAPATGNTSTYTVVGFGRGYVPQTDTIVFVQLADLTLIAVNGVVTKSTAKKFLAVTSITPSAAQPSALWAHFAGVPAALPGSRIFAVRHMEYDDLPLDCLSEADMDRRMSTWRSASTGAPSVWIPRGAQTFLLWYTPSGTSPIDLDGYETPDSTTFDADTDEPECHEEDAQAIPLWACILATCKGITDENAVRRSIFYPEWDAAIKSACKRIHLTPGNGVVFGEYAGLSAGSTLPYERTITNI